MTDCNTTFTDWADQTGNYVDEDYYHQGAQVRRKYDSNQQIGWNAATSQYEAELTALKAQVNTLTSFVLLAKNQGSRKNCNELLDHALAITPDHAHIVYTNSIIQYCADECVKIGLDNLPVNTGSGYKARILKLQKEVPNDTKYSER